MYRFNYLVRWFDCREFDADEDIDDDRLEYFDVRILTIQVNERTYRRLLH
jgi:hypothetical protein